MSDNLSFAELNEQHAELLPERTVLSLVNFSTGAPKCPPGENQVNKAGPWGFNFNWTSGGCQVNSAGNSIPGKPG